MPGCNWRICAFIERHPTISHARRLLWRAICRCWPHKENHAMAKLKRALSITGAAVVIIGASGNAYQPRETFAPCDMQQAVNAYRSPNGLPGPAYWQNRADYVIRAKLDTATKTIRGTTIITYRNNSPDALDALWLQLDQNMYRPGSRGAMSRGGLSRGNTDGMTLDRVTVAVAGKPVAVTPTISDTRARLPLPAELPAHATAVVTSLYHYTVPGEFGGRTAWGRSRDGEIYDLAQWYPRMAVYDDIRGWDTAPYLGQEFYLEYGDFDYAVPVPSDMIVAGSGELVTPAEVLTPTQVARSNLPGGRASLATSSYPAESQGADKWGRSTEYMKDAGERYSRRGYPYPWPAAINIAGFATGMEYPGIVFDGIDDAGKELFWISAHEIGHSWFPMMVGFDERRDAWMDEGFNTFIDTYESDDFNTGEYAPKRDSEFTP